MKSYFPFLIIAVLLLVTAIGWQNRTQNNFSEESVAALITKNIAREISALEKEASRLSQTKWSTLRHPFYLIDKGRISRWSKTSPTIDLRDCQGDFVWRLAQNPHSDLLLYKRKESADVFSIGVIPLRSGFDLVNQYLNATWNQNIFPYDGIKINDEQSPFGKPVYGPGGICLFKIQTEAGAFHSNLGSVFLGLGAALFFLVFLFFWIRHLHRKRKYFLAFAMLFLSLAAVRIAMVQFAFPSRWINSIYFDPRFFASSSFNASVGDFVLNSLIVAIACAYFLCIYSWTELVSLSVRLSGPKRQVIAVTFLTAAYFSFLFPFLFVESIFHDSAIPMDIASSASFTGIRIVALTAFMLGCLASFFFVHPFVRTAKALTSKYQFLVCLISSGLIFIFYFVYSGLNYWPTVALGTIYFLILLFSRHFKSLGRIGYNTFPYLLIAVIVYSAQGAWGVKRFSEEKKLKAMFHSATNLIGDDVLGEFLLNQANTKISEDLFLTASIESPLLSKKLARQKIRQVYLGEYFNRYDVVINLYHADGSPADAESPGDFATSIESFQSDANKTNYEWIYQIRNANAESLKRYISIIPLRKNNSVRGYIVLDLSLRRVVPQQVYPELLSDNRFVQSIRDKDFSYALYNGDKISYRSGSFNFDRDFDPRLLSNKDLFSKGIKHQNQWLAGATNEFGKQIILSAEAYSWFSVVANFSFQVALGVGVVFILLIIYLVRHFSSRLSLNYSSRIQAFVYLSFILPSLAISVIALRMITLSSESQVEKEIGSTGVSISEGLSSQLEGIRGDSIAATSELRERIEEIAQASGVDASLYDKSGALIVSSQEGIFSNQLVMPLTNRAAWEKIALENYNTLNVPNQIGSLEYKSSFFAIKSERDGRLLGVLELPFFNATTESLKSNVLSNVVVTFTAVFLLFSFLASNAIGKLTSPLRFIAKKLKAVSLTNNQPIEWKTNDEIGAMVREYNRMLGNLEQSRTELARQEKESAWREIAKQVAHEIKNPLTPMKLTLQQMERTLLQGELPKEKAENSVQVLLSQIETLNGIAGSFSAFATMPSPVLAKVELVTLLGKTASLYENHSLGKVSFTSSIKSVYVQADEQLLGRIFSNIILNGLQSNKGSQVEVNVGLQMEDTFCTVSLQDNGSGISAELQDKVFLPHFSTKKTGSGLGLAIAKQGIEQMGGTISFQTTVGSGTTFFIKLKTLD